MPPNEDTTSNGSPVKASLKSDETTVSGRRDKAYSRKNLSNAHGREDRATKKARGGETPQILGVPGGEDPVGISKSPGVMTKEPEPLEPAPSTTETSHEPKNGEFKHNGGEDSADLRGEENHKELHGTKAEPKQSHAETVRDTKEQYSTPKKNMKDEHMVVDLESAPAIWVDQMGGGCIIADVLQNMLTENMAEGSAYYFRGDTLHELITMMLIDVDAFFGEGISFGVGAERHNRN